MKREGYLVWDNGGWTPTDKGADAGIMLAKGTDGKGNSYTYPKYSVDAQNAILELLRKL